MYTASERLRWRWSKPVDLIVNGPVRFAVEKKKLYLLDEKGKEHEARIFQGDSQMKGSLFRNAHGISAVP